MKVNDNGNIRDMTAEEITEMEQMDSEIPSECSGGMPS